MNDGIVEYFKHWKDVGSSLIRRLDYSRYINLKNHQKTNEYFKALLAK